MLDLWCLLPAVIWRTASEAVHGKILCCSLVWTAEDCLEGQRGEWLYMCAVWNKSLVGRDKSASVLGLPVARDFCYTQILKAGLSCCAEALTAWGVQLVLKLCGCWSTARLSISSKPVMNHNCSQKLRYSSSRWKCLGVTCVVWGVLPPPTLPLCPLWVCRGLTGQLGDKNQPPLPLTNPSLFTVSLLILVINTIPVD